MPDEPRSNGRLAAGVAAGFALLDYTRYLALQQEMAHLRRAVDGLGQQYAQPAKQELLSQAIPTPEGPTPLERLGAQFGTILLGQGPPIDSILRTLMESQVRGLVTPRLIRDQQLVAAGNTATFTWRPEQGGWLRVFETLNVIAQPHTEQLLATLQVDQKEGSNVAIASGIPMALDWAVSPSLIPMAQSVIRLSVSNQSTQSVRVIVDTTLLELEPNFARMLSQWISSQVLAFQEALD